MKKVTTDNPSAEDHLTCPMEYTLSVIGGKWKLLILWHLSQHQTRRFSELKRSMPSITTKMLTQQLRELEAAEVVNREVFPVVPPKVEYRLSDRGQSLLPVMKALHNWGKDHWVA